MRAIKPHTKEQEEIVRLSSLLKPFDNAERMGLNMESIEEESEDCCSYNGSYFPEWNSERIVRYSAVIDYIGNYEVLRFCYGYATTGYSYIYNFQPYYNAEAHEIARMWRNLSTNETFFMAKDMWIKRCQYWRYNSAYKFRNPASDEYSMLFNEIANIKFAKIKRVDDFLGYMKRIDALFKKHPYSYEDESNDIHKLTSTFGELMYKLHFDALSSLLENNPNVFDKMAKLEKQVRIAHKGKYDFSKIDIDLWCDYVEMLIKYRPTFATQQFYLCPQDLEHSHDWITRIQRKVLFEQKKADAERHNAEFFKHHDYLLGIKAEDDKYYIKSLDTPLEYMEEGDHMNNCIGGYYTHGDSLCLSVWNKATHKRIADCEVSVSDAEIVQLRGNHNDKDPMTKLTEEQYLDISFLIQESIMPILKQRKADKKREKKEKNKQLKVA